MGCSESKADIMKIDPKTDAKNKAKQSVRRPSVSVVRQSSAASLYPVNNNNKGDATTLSSAGSSGRGTKPNTPDEAAVDRKSNDLPGYFFEVVGKIAE